MRTPRQAAAQPAPEPGPALSREIFDILEAAAGEQEAKRALLFTLAWRESRGDPRADNPASSARGLLQFTRTTWLEAVRDHGAALGVGDHAAEIETDRSTGAIAVRNPRRLAAILALRDDPRLSAAMAMKRLESQQARIAAALGRPASDADLYAAHFLGASGTLRFLRALAQSPSASAVNFASRHAVAANRSVFFDARGRRRTVQEVHARIREDLDAQGLILAALRPRAPEHAEQLALAAVP